MMDVTARTLIVDDHPVFRLGVAMLLGREPGIAVVGEVAGSSVALRLAAAGPIDVALIDVILPGDDGVALAAQLHALQPECKIIGLSVIEEPAKIAQMLRAGASGYVLKTQPIEALIEAIQTVRAGGRYLPPQIASDRVASVMNRPESPFDRLTTREREIAGHLVRGDSNLDIAIALAISERTVETHRQRILKKLGAHSIVEVIAVAVRNQFHVTRER